MNCPVCNRSWATALSVCPSCGSDILSDEMQAKKPLGITPRLEARPLLPPVARVEPLAKLTPPPISAPPAIVRPPAPVERRVETAGLASPKTSPTLVGFQNQNAALPDWRLQLQNAVQRRKGAQSPPSDQPGSGIQFPTNGATALKVEIADRSETVSTPTISDPIVAKAMRRIEESRKTFREPETARKPVVPRPFGVVAPTGSPTPQVPAPAGHIPPPKPRLVSPIVQKRDTNKLPPIHITEPVEAVLPPQLETRDVATETPEFVEIKRIQIKADNLSIAQHDATVTAVDEIDDLAPFSMRFGAGLFDMIIGMFASMLLLSPIAFTRGDWFSLMGLLTFAGVSALVLFLYMTVCLGFVGKTLGMRLFSLELVDAVENEYPTLRQAAVNSSVFLLLLGFGGAGFLTLFYNEEKRALHDLLSGTILVREF